MAADVSFCFCHAAPGRRTASPAPSAASEVEREHEEWLRKKREDEEKAEQAAEKQREFDEEKNKALGSMKGIYTNDHELKGVGGADSSGLKGVGGAGSSELKPMTRTGDSALKTIVPLPPATFPRRTPHVVQGAWHQLHCSASISARAISAAEAGASIERIRYLGSQAAAAMNGSPVAVPCDQGPPLRFQTSSSAFWRYRMKYLPEMMVRVSADAAILRKTRAESAALRRRVRIDRQKASRAKAEIGRLSAEPETPAAEARKKRANDAWAEALNALRKARMAKQRVDEAAARAQQDLRKVGHANAAVRQHPDQVDAIFSELMKASGDAVPPPKP